MIRPTSGLQGRLLHILGLSTVVLAVFPAVTLAQPQPAPAHVEQSPQPVTGTLGRWVDLQSGTLNLRYRFVETSENVVTTSQLQHRETLRARLKFDQRGHFALNLGVFTGVRFTSGWDNTGWGINDAQRNLAFKALYLSGQPVTGVEGQFGGLYIVRGQSTEFTTYDEDGYITGERLTLRRPNQLFFDEVAVTSGYFVGGTDDVNVPVSRRLPHITEQNYQQYLVVKRIGRRGSVSADYTTERSRRTWRQAASLRTNELRIIDSVIFETYQRTNFQPAVGYAVSFSKALTKRFSLNQFGYARIDPAYGPLNADRFNIGNRVFFMVTYVILPPLTWSFFATTAIGTNAALPQRTLSNTVLTYDAMPLLKRTGWF